jgi:hypothetical protein
MNIYAKEGHKVIVTEQSARNGYQSDRDLVKKHLIINQVYTVEETFVYEWRTEVALQEFPEITFNSVSFEDYEQD